MVVAVWCHRYQIDTLPQVFESHSTPHACVPVPALWLGIASPLLAITIILTLKRILKLVVILILTLILIPILILTLH